MDEQNGKLADIINGKSDATIEEVKQNFLHAVRALQILDCEVDWKVNPMLRIVGGENAGRHDYSDELLPLHVLSELDWSKNRSVRAPRMFGSRLRRTEVTYVTPTKEGVRIVEQFRESNKPKEEVSDLPAVEDESR